MKTLEEYIKWQSVTGMTDMQIIKAYFIDNDMEEEGMEISHELAKSKIEKMKRQERSVKEWTSYLPSKYLYANYDLDTADWLHTLELDYLTHKCKLSSGRLEWAKENIPNIKMPKVYFQPLVEWLDDKGIRFKGEKPIKEKDKRFSNYV